MRALLFSLLVLCIVGDVVHLTITASPDADAGQMWEAFQVTSTMGGTTNTWVAPVAN